MPFRGQETALQTGQTPLPRPTATPSPRKGKGSSAPAAHCGRTLFTHLFFLLVFNMRNFYYLICNPCRCGRIPLLFKKGCPKGGVVIWKSSGFIMESMPFRGQGTALLTGQTPLPRPAATPSPRKGNGPSAQLPGAPVFSSFPLHLLSYSHSFPAKQVVWFSHHSIIQLSTLNFQLLTLNF